MMTCEQAARLLSDSLDRPLPLRQRIPLRMHLFMCKFCPRFLRQLLLLREAAKRYTEEGEGKFSLPIDARERIKRLLADQSKEVPPRKDDK